MIIPSAIVFAFLYYYYFNSTQSDDLSFNPAGLKSDLRNALFGQHIVSDVVLKAVSSFMADKNTNKPLVLSFHGIMGTGKNHAFKIIARNMYEKGEKSKHIHTFISPFHFPHKENVHMYCAQLKQWIHGNVSSFPHSMFIFDEMDKMHPELIDILKPFLDYNDNVDGVSFHNAIFIFLSNTGGKVIADLALDFWREGRKREEIKMNSRDLEIMISESISKNEKSGFWHSSLIEHHLIDHYIPFLPLELRHVRQCVLTEMEHLNKTQDAHLADKVARDMPFFPKIHRVFAEKGCKSVRQKLALYVDE
ncbi:torsin-1A-like [Danio aesculapii]|uniref:torsin-1A-like n=1 Tax=Danio aesculapii TaxID=1142201 RepID=UPI0024C0BE14|nr:torsin-1A-like [Danio aesculapii]